MCHSNTTYPQQSRQVRGTTAKDDVSQSYQESTPRVREAICEPVFCNPEVGRPMASCLQFEKPEKLYPDRALQDGASKSCVRPPLPRLVYVQTRSKGCVPFDSHSSGQSEVAPFSVARSNVAIQVPAIRTIRCATYIHQDPGPCSRVPEITRHSPCDLPGRLAISRCNSRGRHKIGRRGNVSVGAPGLDHFRRQVNIEASSVPEVLRNSSRFCIHALSSSRPEVHWNQQGLSPYVEQGHCLSLNTAALARQDVGCGQSCSIGAGKVKDATVSAEHAPRRTSESGPVEHCLTRLVMVDSPDSFSAMQTYSDLTAVPDSDNRCIQLWMACDLQLADGWRTLDHRGRPSHQLEEAESRLPGTEDVLLGQVESDNPTRDRQYHSRGVRESARWNTLILSMYTSERNLGLGSGPSPVSDCNPHSWCQRNSGLLVSSSDG